MSKRTVATPTGRPRRRGFPRLSDVRIQSKLGLILLVPILAVVALAGVELATQVQTLAEARQVNSTIQLSNKAGKLIQDLQDERLSAAQVLMGAKSHRTALDDFRQQGTRTDRSVDAYRAQRETLKNPPADLVDSLGVIDNQLTSLSKDVRLEVLSPDENDATVASVTFRYQVLISELLDLRQSVVKLADDRSLSDELSANAALSQAKEFAAQEQLALLRVINDDRGFDNTSFESFLGTLTGQQSAYDAFNRTASDTQETALQTGVNGPRVQDSTALETDARTGGTGGSLSISAASWNQAMRERISAIRSVEKKLDATAAAHAEAQVNSVIRKVIIESAAGLLVLLVAISLALLVARAMARSLRRLREGALRVAYEGLPQAVSQLRSAEDVGNMSAEEIASRVGDPVQVRGRDEIGQVSEAFNVVHREAVRVAAEQAVLRASVSTMFVNLARRSQLLVDRLIGHLDRLEQGEEDPDRLAQLFQLDHLATRMRRNDENLLVLAGADSSRARREAAPLGDVLRAAQSEVEQYTRIEFGVVDRDVEVEASAVNDVVHLVAELLDNATSFSSPDTAVVVDARRVGDRAIVQIEDRGIGMANEVLAEVNERLAAPPVVDVAVSRMMGLVVVGRLASRLGIRIELRPASERGTVADVILPSDVLVSLDRTSRRPLSGLPSQPALEARPEPALPEPATTGTMPGIPFQPSARESLADAAGMHERTNGSGLPQREPTQAYDVGPEPPVRRSLFEPSQQRPSAPEPSPYDQEQNGEAASWSAGETTSLPRREQHPTVADGLLPRRARQDDPSEAVTTQWHMPREDEGDGRSTDSERTRSGLPRRPVPETSSGWSAETGVDQQETGRVVGGLAAGGSSDMTVETPHVAAPAEQTTASPTADWQQGRQPSTNMDRRDESAGQSRDSTSGAGRLDSAGTGQASSGSGQSEIIPRNVDDTMELPIFREVESAWFRTSPSRPRSASASGRPPAPSPTPGPPSAPADRRPSGGPGADRRPGQPRPGEPGRGSPLPSRQPAPRPSEDPAAHAVTRPAEVPSDGRPDIDPWRSAADKGWQAASAVHEAEPPTETTSSGLPKRRPMAQLVPGGVEDAAEPAKARERSPEAVRGLLSAYHRGVQRGRSSGGASRASASGHRSTDGGAGEEQEA